MLTPSGGSPASSSYAWVYGHQDWRFDASVGLYDVRARVLNLDFHVGKDSYHKHIGEERHSETISHQGDFL